jgi:hypothetical protein
MDEMNEGNGWMNGYNEWKKWINWMHEWMKWTKEMDEMDEWMDIMNERNGWIGWMNGWNELTLVSIEGVWMKGWMGGLEKWMNGWIGEMDEWMCIFFLICVAAFSYHITFDFLLCCQKPTKNYSNWKTQ